MSPSNLNRMIIALDNMDKQKALDFIKKTQKYFSYFKVGMELFYKEGPELIYTIADTYKKKIFLDLKLHDIPNTVFQSIAALKGLPIEFLTIHLSGGKNMIAHALKSARQSLPNTKLLGVSYLTSLDKNDFKELYNINAEQIPSLFKNLFKLADELKIDGIVCSPEEIKYLNHPLITICPGIRFSEDIKNDKTHDQKRYFSPSQAFQEGAQYIVIGRSLTKEEDPFPKIQKLMLN